MKKRKYLFKGVTANILKVLAEERVPEIKKYIDKIESVDVQVKLTSLEVIVARKQINDINKECGTKLRLLKMKD